MSRKHPKPIPGVPIYEMAKKRLDSMFTSWNLHHQEYIGTSQYFLVETDFCKIEGHWSDTGEDVVRFGPLSRDPGLGLLTVTAMQQLFREVLMGGFEDSQLAWLQNHGVLFRSWCEPDRFLPLYDGLTHITESVLQIIGPAENPFELISRAYDLPVLNKKALRAIPREAAVLLERGQYYLSRIVPGSDYSVRSIPSPVATIVEVWDARIHLVLTSCETHEWVEVAPSAPAADDPTLSIERMIKLIPGAQPFLTLETQLHFILSHRKFFDRALTVEAFEATALEFDQFDREMTQIRNMASLSA
jgi:hypothetical protein